MCTFHFEHLVLLLYGISSQRATKRLQSTSKAVYLCRLHLMNIQKLAVRCQKGWSGILFLLFRWCFWPFQVLTILYITNVNSYRFKGICHNYPPLLFIVVTVLDKEIYPLWRAMVVPTAGLLQVRRWGIFTRSYVPAYGSVVFPWRKWKMFIYPKFYQITDHRSIK